MLKRKRFSPIERAFIALRADDCCEYCQILHDFSPDTFEIEHIIPLAEGGTNEFNNLAFSCGGCNSRKGYKIKATDPVSGSMVNLFNPRIDNWEEHFTWSDNFSIVEGSTPIGRATLALLHLNRKGVVKSS